MKKQIKRILMISSTAKLGGGTKHMFTLGEKIKSDYKVFYAIPKSNNYSNYLNEANHFPIFERSYFATVVLA